MNADLEVMRFIGDGSGLDRARSAEFLARLRAAWSTYGFGRWAVERRADGAFAGFCGVGFVSWAPELAGEPEIGWRLPRVMWGHGYATEAAIASRDDFFATTGYDHLISLANPGNAPSIRIMRKIGMRRVADVTHPRVGPIWCHRLDRADWTAAA